MNYFALLREILNYCLRNITIERYKKYNNLANILYLLYFYIEDWVNNQLNGQIHRLDRWIEHNSSSKKSYKNKLEHVLALIEDKHEYIDCINNNNILPELDLIKFNPLTNLINNI